MAPAGWPVSADVILFSPAWRGHSCAEATAWAAERGCVWRNDSRGHIALRPMQIRRATLEINEREGEEHERNAG